VFERTLYNGLLSGVSLDGTHFFYPNPLESRGQHERSPWFGVACCPGNITRFLPSVPGYFYATQGDRIFANLYASGHADIKLGKRHVKLTQKTSYPWSGDIGIAVAPSSPGKFELDLRIPGWARNQAVPSDLYRFETKLDEPATLSVNGKKMPLVMRNGYARISRRWKRGDSVHLMLPMPVRRIVANSKVAADAGRTALQRGPIVYCLEWPDNPGGHVRNVMLPDSAMLSASFKPKLLNGVETVSAVGDSLRYRPDGSVERQSETLTAIPYYSWANRGRGEMEVWIPDSIAAAHPTPQPTIASTSKVTASRGTNPRAINDMDEPRSSGDESSFFHWWPKKGTDEWVEYTFKAPATVSEADLYWFDDTGRGECRTPLSWRLFYKDGDTWKPVETQDTFGVDKDRYNVIKFRPVTTTGMRLEVKLKPNWSAGIEEWKLK
jgi:hypothetical protein